MADMITFKASNREVVALKAVQGYLLSIRPDCKRVTMSEAIRYSLRVVAKMVARKEKKGA